MVLSEVDPFDVRAARYGSVVKTYRDPALHDLMRAELQPWPGSRLLDLAAGQGDASSRFSSEGVRVIAMDRNLPMLSRGLQRETIRQGHAVLADLLAAPLPFHDGVFDLAVMRYALHDCQQPVPFLRDVRRVLTRGGRLQIVDLAPRSPRAVAFCNEIHRLKTPGALAQSWLKGPGELADLVTRSGFSPRDARWYISRVRTTQWQAEGQVTQDRLEEIHGLIKVRVDADDPVIHELEVSFDSPAYCFAFPIVILTAQAA